MNVTYSNPQTGERKLVKVGFSWPLFLFTEFYGLPLFIRGLHMHGAIVAGFGIFSLLVQQTPLLPVAGLLLIGSMVFYGIKGNELTMRHLEQKGWIRDAGQAVAAPYEPAPALQLQARGGQTNVVKVLAIVGAVLLGLIVIGAIVDANDTAPAIATAQKEQPNSAARQDQAEAAAPASIDVTATELYRAYEANEQAAQTKYGAQPVRVSGAIASIELDAADQPMVSLRAGSMLAEVTLHFDDSFAKTAGELNKGEWFSAECKTISELLGAPQLEDCSTSSLPE